MHKPIINYVISFLNKHYDNLIFSGSHTLPKLIGIYDKSEISKSEFIEICNNDYSLVIWVLLELIPNFIDNKTLIKRYYTDIITDIDHEKYSRIFTIDNVTYGYWYDHDDKQDGIDIIDKSMLEIYNRQLTLEFGKYITKTLGFKCTDALLENHLKDFLNK